jgi:rare lipoprotein A
MPGAAGRTVRLQRHSASGWHTVADGRTGRRGRFSLHYAPGGGTDRRLRVLFGGDATNAGTTGAAGSVSVFYPDVASWYNDAGDTACGFHAGLGVANRTLPCGTRVAFHYGGRTVTAVVDDRGPYVGGRDWDLNQNTAAALGFAGVGALWVSR